MESNDHKLNTAVRWTSEQLPGVKKAEESRGMTGTSPKCGTLRNVETRSPAGSRPTKRSFLTLLLGAAGALAVAVVSALRPRAAHGRGYQRVVRWKHPESEGLFIAVEPEPSADTLRAVGRRLRQDFLDWENVVVMIFDDARAAREVSRGSRIMGEKRFLAALAHQRAMYLKNAGRKEHKFTIYASYPVSREVIRY
ncbi:MAG: hypothetical protein ACE5IQ_04360 [Candidatus Methylomirabilales bacterium]